mmetsp:Transcript_16701/g.47620  ORF Transcript_16701/g.47620 Transcript_16701/m.47620 type:complete len:449 (-) Transcript_16701:142-1488(-)
MAAMPEPPRELPDELQDLKVHGPSQAGWDAAVEPNETMDAEGRLPPLEARGFGQMDMSPRLPKRRDPHDPSVEALREHLRRNNGIKGLEICEPWEVDRAAKIFHRDGFVVVKDCLNKEQLDRWREGCARVLKDILKYPGPEGRKYITESGRLPHRYSFGTASASRHMLHDPVWASMVDLPTITPIITKIYGSPDYAINGAGGDLCLPGAIEYQHLHRDGPPFGEGEFRGKLLQRRLDHAQRMGIDLKGKKAGELSLNRMRAVSESLPASGTINFLMVDSTWENGPIRQIPGTHANVQIPPSSAEEPEWMRLSTLVGAPAGSGIFRDHRAWHGATPNLSNEIRCMPNIEWTAPWLAGPGTPKTMPHEIWETLTPHGKHICRFVHSPPGVWPPGAGVMHPLAAGRFEAFKHMGGLKSADELGEGTRRAMENYKKNPTGGLPQVAAVKAKL